MPTLFARLSRFMTALEKHSVEFFCHVNVGVGRLVLLTREVLSWLMFVWITFMITDVYLEWRTSHERTYTCDVRAEEWGLFDLMAVPSAECVGKSGTGPRLYYGVPSDPALPPSTSPSPPAK